MNKMIPLLRDWTPPAIWRLARKLASHPALQRQNDPEARGADFYDQTFRSRSLWHEHYTESIYYPLWLLTADRMLRSGTRSVLDIGCGPGQVAMLLRDKGIVNYLGVDFSRERIQQARKVCPEFDFVEADIFQSDLLDAHHYDTVICIEFLEHVDGDTDVIEKIQPGSLFLGSVPNFPTAGHVRHFLDTDSVTERYSRYFTSFRVDSIQANPEGTIQRFLMEGVRK